MLTIRAARTSDLDDLMELSAETGAGMTTMPVDRSSWSKKLALTESSFLQDIANKKESVFVLVLEEMDTKRVIGSSALIASVGSKMPFYSYKVSTQVMVSTELNINSSTQILHLVNDFTGCTELASLFLSKDYRSNPQYRGAGRFLSLSRFLLIHDFPTIFSDRIFAELRGFLDGKGESPFWEALGKKFFDLEYSRADLLSAISGNQFISDLMPKHPIYLDLLPEEAKAVVGKANLASVPAMRLLEKEGFLDTGYVDIFDAGPSLESRKSQIRTLQNTSVGGLEALPESADSQSTDLSLFMVSNQSPNNYRVVLTRGHLKTQGAANKLIIPQTSIDALEVSANRSQISWTPFGENKK